MEADRLYPLWQQRQEQEKRLFAVRHRYEEVNTRLQDALIRRQRIRALAAQQSKQRRASLEEVNA